MFGLLVEDMLLGAFDAHDDRVAAAGHDPLRVAGQIGLHLAIDAWKALRGFADLGHCLVVVGLVANADPNLSGLDAGHLVTGDCAADMAGDRAHALDTAQFGAQTRHQPDHAGMRSSGRASQEITASRSLKVGTGDQSRTARQATKAHAPAAAMT